MQKFESIPKTVLAVQFILPIRAEGAPPPDRFTIGSPDNLFQASWPVQFNRAEGYFIDMNTESGPARCYEGGWIVRNGDALPYPVGEGEFNRLYREPNAAIAGGGWGARENTRLKAIDPDYEARLADLGDPKPGQYIGTKIIEMVRPESRPLPGQAGERMEGYVVRYPDGYESWSPAAAFLAAYQPTSGLTFGLALAGTMRGYRACRAGWNGHGQWVAMSPGSKALPYDRFWNPNNRAFASGQPGRVADVMPCMTIKNAHGEIVMGWAPSQGDLFATDWLLLEPLEELPDVMAPA
jgi:hypothetical protein